MNFVGREHSNGAREQTVDGAAQIGNRDRIGDAEGGHLFERVYAGVGAAGAGHVYRRAFHTGENFFQNALNGGQAGLHLPSMKRAAVVSQVDTDAAAPIVREPRFTTGTPS